MYRILIMAVMALILTTGSAHAQASIGVIDMQLIASQSGATKNAMVKMQSKYGKQRDQLNKEAKNLQAKEQALSKQFATLSKSALKSRQTEFMTLQKNFAKKSRAFSMNVEKDEIKIKQDIFKLVTKASATVAKRKKMNFIVDIAAGGVLYYTKRMDVTKDVLAEVDRLWRAGKK